MARKKKVIKSDAAKMDVALHIPMSEKSKNIGAVKSLIPDSAGVEKLASMEPNALKEHLKTAQLDRTTVDAVMKRHLEIQGSKPKPVKELEDNDGKIKCDCGCLVYKKFLSNHKKTKEHKKKV